MTITAQAVHDHNDTYRVLVSGWRDWPVTDAWAVHSALERVRKALPLGIVMVVVEGACPFGGADLFAYQWAVRAGQHGWNVVPERHPADFGRLGSVAGPKRNREMVDAGAHEALVFLGPRSKGTIGCLNMIMDANIPARVLPYSRATLDRLHLELFGRLP